MPPDRFTGDRPTSPRALPAEITGGLRPHGALITAARWVQLMEIDDLDAIAQLGPVDVVERWADGAGTRVSHPGGWLSATWAWLTRRARPVHGVCQVRYAGCTLVYEGVGTRRPGSRRGTRWSGWLLVRAIGQDGDTVDLMAP